MNKKPDYKKKRNSVILSIIFCAMVMLFAFGQRRYGAYKYTNIVRSATPAGYEKTYGEAMDAYFREGGTWDAFQNTEKGNYIIQYSGVCDYDGGTRHAVIQFTLGDNKEVNVSYVGLNEQKIEGQAQEDFWAVVFE